MNVDFIEACRRFIEIDSTPDNGTLEVAQFAGELCRKAGLHVELQNESYHGVDQANVIARPLTFRPEAEFMLLTHLDTADPGGYGLWTKTGANPFNASIYLDTVYGLGAASAKLDFLCKLQAVSELKGATWRLPFVLVGTFGEEIGMQGAIKLVRKKKVNAKMALVGEPTELRLSHAGKGFAGVEIDIPFSEEEMKFREQHDLGDGATSQSRVFVGRAAHSSVPQMGESAITKLFEYLTRLPQGLAVMEIEGGISYNTVPSHAVLEIDMVGDLENSMAGRLTRINQAIADVEERFKDLADEEFDPPEPSLNVGMVRTFEDHIRLCGCVRLTPSVSDVIYEEWMAILRNACQEIGADFRVINYKQPFRTGLDEPLVQACRQALGDLGRSMQCVAQSVTTEANVFNRFGIASLVIGPGRGVGNSHAPNEHVKIEELHEAVRFYKGVLERVCL
jgi:succinyl-diaminopimelate desuccinylase